MPIRKEDLQFDFDLKFLEKMDNDLAYSLEEMAELILAEPFPLDSIEDITKFLKPDWEYIKEYFNGTIESIIDDLIPRGLGYQTGRLVEYFSYFTKIMSVIQSCRIQGLLTIGYDKNGKLYCIKTYSNFYK